MRSRSILLSGCALLFAALLALPAAAQTANNDVGFTRFAHTAIDVGPIDIYVGANPQPIVTNLKYGDVTDFMALPVTASGYIARAAGSPADSKPLFSLNWGVKANKSEMITAAGLNSRKAFLLEPMTLVRNKTNGKARVRSYDTVWGGPFLSVGTTQGIGISQNQQYLNPSNDTDLAPGVYDFEVKDSSGKTVATLPGVKLEADKVYVMLILGGAAGNPPVKLIPIVSDEESTRVQFVNQSNSALDVYVKGETKPFVTGLANGASTPLTALPSDSVTFVARNSGGSVSDKEVAFVALQLYPGRDTVITISNAGGGVQMKITSNTLTPMATPTAEATLMATMQATAQATLAQ
ncbi:MAG: hypothetical protein ACYDBJ_20480 [Aggregatilineales bacterium]